MLWNDRLMINPNIFYTSYEDLQISEEVENMHYIVVNAGEAHATGIEIDWHAKLSGSVELYGSLGIIQTEYDEYEENQGYGDQDYSGNKMVNAPAYTFNLGAKYRNPNGFFASMDFKRFGETYFSSDNASKVSGRKGQAPIHNKVHARGGGMLDQSDLPLARSFSKFMNLFQCTPGTKKLSNAFIGLRLLTFINDLFYKY